MRYFWNVLHTFMTEINRVFLSWQHEILEAENFLQHLQGLVLGLLVSVWCGKLWRNTTSHRIKDRKDKKNLVAQWSVKPRKLERKGVDTWQKVEKYRNLQYRNYERRGKTKLLCISSKLQLVATRGHHFVILAPSLCASDGRESREADERETVRAKEREREVIIRCCVGVFC